MTSDAGSIIPHDFKISHIAKEEREGQKFIRLTGTLQGHAVTLILSLDRKSKRDKIIKQIQSKGLTITGRLGGSNQFEASASGAKGELFLLKIDSKVDFSHMAGAKLRLLQQESDQKSSRPAAKASRAGYTALQTPPQQQRSVVAGRGSENIPASTAAPAMSGPIIPPKPQRESEKIPMATAAPVIQSDPLIPPKPQRMPPKPQTIPPKPPRGDATAAPAFRTGPSTLPNPPAVMALPGIEMSMMEEIERHRFFRAGMNVWTAGAALQNPQVPPGSVIISKESNPPIFIVTIKLPDGRLSLNSIVVEKPGVYRVQDSLTGEVKLGGGAGYGRLDDCLAALWKNEHSTFTARTMPPAPGPAAAQPPVLDALASLEGRASRLFQDLQGLKGTLREMGCREHEMDLVLKNLCYTVAQFEQSPLATIRHRKNVPIFLNLGLSLPFTLYIDRNPGNGGVTLSMTTPGVVQGAVIGQGTFKVVKSHYTIGVPDAGSGQLPSIRSHEVVLLRAKKGHEPQVLAGLETIKRLQLEIGPDVIPGPIVQRFYTSKANKTRFEFTQTKFNGDFDRVIREGYLPLRTAVPAMRRFNLSDKLDALIDISGKLQRFHAVGYIHRDVKPPNMLLELVETPGSVARVVAFPSDIDLTGRAGFVGATVEGRKYPWWDPCAREGIVTPVCDVYGLAYTLGQTLFSNFLPVVHVATQIHVNQDFARLMPIHLRKKFTELGILTLGGEQKLREIQQAGPDVATYCQAVDRFLQQVCDSGSLPAGKIEEIRQFRIELSQLPAMWALIAGVLNQSHGLYSDIQARPEILIKIQSKDPREVQQGFAEIMALANQRGIPSAQQFGDLLRQVRGRMATG